MGGGPSGAVSFPVYMENIHNSWLRHGSVGSDVVDNSIIDLINTAQGEGGNPYEGETSFDPDAAFAATSGSPLDKMSDQFDSLTTLVAALASEDYFSTYPTIDLLTTLATDVGTMMTAIASVLNNANVTSMVTAFETNKKARFLREISSWTAGMADVNAVNSSSFVIGMALRQKDFDDSVDMFERELKINILQKMLDTTLGSYLKGKMVIPLSKTELFNRGPDIYAKLARLKMELERLNIIALKEKKDVQLHIEEKEALWDFEVMMYGVNVLSAINGAPAGRKATSSAGQTALAGALIGAAIGMEAGPVGAAVGAGAGALVAILSNQSWS